MLGVRTQIKIGTVGDTLQLAPIATLEAEAILDIDGALGVVRKLFLGVLVETQIIGVNAEVSSRIRSSRSVFSWIRTS